MFNKNEVKIPYLASVPVLFDSACNCLFEVEVHSVFVPIYVSVQRLHHELTGIWIRVQIIWTCPKDSVNLEDLYFGDHYNLDLVVPSLAFFEVDWFLHVIAHFPVLTCWFQWSDHHVFPQYLCISAVDVPKKVIE